MTTYGMNVLYPASDYPTIPVKIRLWDIGVTWNILNPADGVFNWAPLDAVIDAHPGVNFLMVLHGTPNWCALYNNTTGASWIGAKSNSPPTAYVHWDRFVTAIVTRYIGKIQAYQIWNEPQLLEFWDPWGEIAKLGTMTHRAYDIIKKINPTAKVVAAPVLPRSTSGGMTKAAAYLTQLQAQGWPVDVFDAHPYPLIGEGTAAWRDQVQAVKTGLKAKAAPVKPLWLTETNYNLGGGQLATKTMVQNYIQRTHEAAVALGVDRIYWYAWGVHTNPNLFGIRFVNGSAGTEALKVYL